MGAKPTVFFIVRHGLSDANQAGIISGHINPSLTDEGRRQAHTAKNNLAHIKFDEAYSSDLERAIETASIIHGLPVPEHHRLVKLRERNFGVIDGLPEHKFSSYQTKKMSLPPEERSHYKYAEGMESDHELAQRYIEALNMIVESHPGSVILVGSHGSAMRSLLVHIGWATHNTLPPGSIENTAYVELIHNNGDISVGNTSGINRVKY